MSSVPPPFSASQNFLNTNVTRLFKLHYLDN